MRALRRRVHDQIMGLYGPLVMRYVAKQHSWRWRGLTLRVPSGVFHPGLFFSSGVLADQIVRRHPVGRTVLDVGCGSGLLALAAARSGAVVTAIDINAAAVAATLANASANALTVEALQSDLFVALAGRRFDLVVVNPPYFDRDPADDAEHAWFAGAGLTYFDRFFAGLGEVVAVDGIALMVLAESCDLATIRAAADRAGRTLREVHRKMVFLGVQVVYEIRCAP